MGRILVELDLLSLLRGILWVPYRQEHFPGLVRYAEALEPAYTYEHYVSAPDAEDETGHTYDSVAERVMTEFWVSLPPTTLLNTLHSPEFVEPVY